LKNYSIQFSLLTLECNFFFAHAPRIPIDTVFAWFRIRSKNSYLHPFGVIHGSKTTRLSLRRLSFPPGAFHELSVWANGGRNLETSGYSSAIIPLRLGGNPGLHNKAVWTMRGKEKLVDITTRLNNGREVRFFLSVAGR